MLEIIIPVYKAKNTLPKALDSIVAQTYDKPFITCLSIDGDGEDYNDIINTYEKRGINFRLINSKLNGGPGIARQRALDTTQATYVMFLDADDMLLPRAVEVLYNNAKYNQYDVMKSCYIRSYINGGAAVMGQSGQSITHMHGKIYRVQYLKDNNIRFPEDLPFEEDAYFNLFGYNAAPNKGETNEFTYLWREHKTSLTQFNKKNDEYFKKSYKIYINAQIRGLIKLRSCIEFPDKLLSDTLMLIYYHYQHAKYYNLDTHEIDEWLKTFGALDWVKKWFINADNWFYVAQNIKSTQSFGDNILLFYNEPFDVWCKKIFKE